MRRENHTIDIFRGIKIFGELNKLIKWNQIYNNENLNYYKKCESCGEDKIKNNHLLFCQKTEEKLKWI